MLLYYICHYALASYGIVTRIIDRTLYIVWRNTISHIEVEMGPGVFPVLQWCPPGMTYHIFVPSLLAGSS